MNSNNPSLNEEQLKAILTRLFLSGNGSNFNDVNGSNNLAQQQLLQLILNYTSQVQGNIQNIINSLSSALPRCSEYQTISTNSKIQPNTVTTMADHSIPSLYGLTSRDVDHFLSTLSSNQHCMDDLSPITSDSSSLNQTSHLRNDENTSCSRYELPKTPKRPIQSSSTSSDGSISISCPLVKDVNKRDQHIRSSDLSDTSGIISSNQGRAHPTQHRRLSGTSSMMSNNSSLVEKADGNLNNPTLRSLLVDTPGIVKKSKYVNNLDNGVPSKTGENFSDSSDHSSVTFSPASSAGELVDDMASTQSFNVDKNQSYSSLYNSCSSIESSNRGGYIQVQEQPLRKVKSDTGSRRLHRQDDIDFQLKSGFRTGYQSPSSSTMYNVGGSNLNDKSRLTSSCATPESQTYHLPDAPWINPIEKSYGSSQNIRRDSRKYKRSFGSISDSNPEQNVADSNHSYPNVRIPRLPSLSAQYSNAADNLELKILRQPEEQHRARYMTEGSRGAIKGRNAEGFPVVQLIGWDQPVTLQVFVATDSGKVKPNSFYQACRVSGKNCVPCRQRNFDGTNVIELTLESKVSINCIGILKLRNADVEQRIGSHYNKKKSTKARLVFRVNLPRGNGTFTTLQCVSDQILCTQPMGSPEIGRMSLSEGSCLGGKELFIIGRNFTKDIKVIFKEVSDSNDNVWEQEAPLSTEFFQQTHLVCQVPPYCRVDMKSPVTVQIILKCDDRVSEPHYFTYLPEMSTYSSNNTTNETMKWSQAQNVSNQGDFYHDSTSINSYQLVNTQPFSCRMTPTSHNYSQQQPIPIPSSIYYGHHQFGQSDNCLFDSEQFFSNKHNTLSPSSSAMDTSDVSCPILISTTSSTANTFLQDDVTASSTSGIFHQKMFSERSAYSMSESDSRKLSSVPTSKWDKDLFDSAMDNVLFSSSLNTDNSAEYFLPLSSASGSDGCAIPSSTNTLTESSEFLSLS